MWPGNHLAKGTWLGPPRLVEPAAEEFHIIMGEM